jgi:hypothetical protein
MLVPFNHPHVLNNKSRYSAELHVTYGAILKHRLRAAEPANVQRLTVLYHPVSKNRAQTLPAR